ncbi:2-hydroxyacid dehydrogenase [Rhodalgimonas zhirmunskyi]|uniref:Glyoxylate/hydroxypyruvate reductase A n=1 Tax=Rhodalgimonas zhirmunskyi TaxID=2964767 RepID=A0AAJ1UE39_9RHOB|nr:glyoxylate/hydroxypyruvate reductase A [Rhodoalgimonas zhirmunskyi]MDQ2094646.1 glyoxylate/hydroxypyruvate reductase A [Rhodoalgimonas zhirmunskyi]
MTTTILFAAKPQRWVEYQQPLHEALGRTGLDYRLGLDFPPDEVDYIVYAPNSDLQDFTPYNNAKAVLNLWAGVEAITKNATLKIPLARMVGGGLTEGMVEWVTAHVLRHHLGMDAHIVNPAHEWKPAPPPLASERPVTILGLGQLGLACGEALAYFGFPVRGWSRNPKQVKGIETFHGNDGLLAALKGTQGVVLLLPDTPATHNVINTETLSQVAQGAFLLNPGRGPLIQDTALLQALDSGRLSHATLDTFRQEPLPADHPFWSHPKVTVTPHIASETRAGPASEVIVENIRRGEAGEPFLHLVDRSAGY